MKQYTITLTDAEDKALSIVAISQQEWIENVVLNRCRIAIEEIVDSEVNRITSEGGTLSGSKEDIVLSTQIETAAERQERLNTLEINNG